jgi:hypothetical protein
LLAAGGMPANCISRSTRKYLSDLLMGVSSASVKSHSRRLEKGERISC